MKKSLVFGVLSLLTASFLVSQSVVDASKKEQERREKLKGKNVKVVTNADLKAKDNRPAVAVAAPEAVKAEPQVQAEGKPGAEAVGAGGQPAAASAQPAETPFAIRYAASLSPDYFLVENPDLALGPPDDKFAEVSVTGVLDLEIEVNNGPGNDLSVHARPPAKAFPQEEMGGQLEADQAAMWWGDFRYAVMGLDQRGEWQEIGLGAGGNPDEFDLGVLQAAKKIRIMFKPYSNAQNQGEKPARLAGREMTFGLDAVGALH